MTDHSQKWHNGTSTRTRSTNTYNGLAAIQAQLNNLGREIKKVNERVYAAQVRCESCGGRYRVAAPGFYQRDNRNPLYQERRETMEESLSKFMAESAMRHDKNSNLINRLIIDSYKEKEALKSLLMDKPRIGYQIEASINVRDSAILEDSLPPKEKYPGRLSKLTPIKLIIKLADRTIKRPKGIAENVLVGLRERMELDLEGRLMREALILNRSCNPTYGDYIELNDLNEPLKLRRNPEEDSGLTIEDGEVINEPMKDITETRNDNEEIEGIDEYLIIENMDSYRDEDMGEIIMGKPFCKEICVKAKQFDGMITI
ncbi:hypothetical protein Tco_1155074 [Tanacetum coccineum]